MSRTTKQRIRRTAVRLALLPSGLAGVITLSILTSSGYALAEGKWVAPVLLVGIAISGFRMSFACRLHMPYMPLPAKIPRSK